MGLFRGRAGGHTFCMVIHICITLCIDREFLHVINDTLKYDSNFTGIYINLHVKEEDACSCFILSFCSVQCLQLANKCLDFSLCITHPISIN